MVHTAVVASTEQAHEDARRFDSHQFNPAAVALEVSALPVVDSDAGATAEITPELATEVRA